MHIITLILGLSIATTCTVKAQGNTNITVQAQDPLIKYYTVPDRGANSTWGVNDAGTGGCSTAQMMTSRLGDYAVYEFNASAVYVFGTVGVKRGIITFTLDGINTTFDRSHQPLMCDYPLFQRVGMPLQPHKLIATLVQEEPDFSNATLYDAVLSIQRITTTLPDGFSSDGPNGSNPAGGSGAIIPESSKSNAGPIAGGVIGGILGALLICAGVAWYLRRRAADNRDVLSIHATEDPHPHQFPLMFAYHNPDVVVTPFEWQRPPSLVRNPDSDSSVTDEKRTSSSPSMLGNGVTPNDTPSPPPRLPDGALADQIALRLADIMIARNSVIDPGAPPPIYEGRQTDPERDGRA